MGTQYAKVASDELLNTTVEALQGNGFSVNVVENADEAKKAVLKLIPKGSEVFTNTSVTLDEAGIAEVLNGSDYVSARNKMLALYGDPKKKKEMKRIAGTPEFAIGSAHAITQDGKILVASASGSQIPAEAYGSENVIFVVGAQKLVKDLDEGIKRIEEYVVPLEDERAMAAYGTHTALAKLLVLMLDSPERVTVIIIKDKIGF
ncbi:MAG TPA: LUD domain-containing protein [Candidatus Limnocylindria bacterium]|nr:LUD domain-containing protein [Candidatus Limnocylindria bacterium]